MLKDRGCWPPESGLAGPLAYGCGLVVGVAPWSLRDGAPVGRALGAFPGSVLGAPPGAAPGTPDGGPLGCEPGSALGRDG